MILYLSSYHTDKENSAKRYKNICPNVAYWLIVRVLQFQYNENSVPDMKNIRKIYRERYNILFICIYLKLGH